LLYDATNAARSSVFDDQADWFGSGDSPWLDERERAAAGAAEAAARAGLEAQRKRGGRPLTLSLALGGAAGAVVRDESEARRTEMLAAAAGVDADKLRRVRGGVAGVVAPRGLSAAALAESAPGPAPAVAEGPGAGLLPGRAPGARADAPAPSTRRLMNPTLTGRAADVLRAVVAAVSGRLAPDADADADADGDANSDSDDARRFPELPPQRALGAGSRLQNAALEVWRGEALAAARELRARPAPPGPASFAAAVATPAAPAASSVASTGTPLLAQLPASFWTYPAVPRRAAAARDGRLLPDVTAEEVAATRRAGPVRV
jgi:hypothetical protein